MKTYIVLIRGINVGGKNKIVMEELKSLLEKHDCHNVKTYIQSGNVILQSQKHPYTRIQNLIDSTYGFKPELIILETVEFGRILEKNPYKTFPGNTVHFYFCKDEPIANPERIEALKAPSEELHIADRVCYLHAPSGIARSKLSAKIESCLGTVATGRNLNTVNKILNIVETLYSG